MQPHVPLQAYRAERDALLDQIQQVLTQDSRVCAAWLWGSLGRAEADELSDLDLWIVVADAYLDQVAAERRAYVARVGAPLVVVDAPQNAPLSGAYLLAVYAGDIGPHQVDWYWQAQSAAYVPPNTRMLFERVTLPRSDADPRFPGTQKPPERGPLEQVTHHIHFFWAMLPIAAKHVGRWPEESQSTMLECVRRPLAEVQAFLDQSAPVVQDEDVCSASDPLSELALLRAYASRMETLLPGLAKRGVDLPEVAIASQVCGYLDMIEAQIRLDCARGADCSTG